MLGDAYTNQYLNNPRIKPFSEFIALGGVSAKNGDRRHRLLRAEQARARLSSRRTSRSRSATGSSSRTRIRRTVMDWAVKTIKAAL